MKVYLGCYTSDFMDQFGKLDDTIYDVPEARGLNLTTT